MTVGRAATMLLITVVSMIAIMSIFVEDWTDDHPSVLSVISVVCIALYITISLTWILIQKGLI